MAKITSKHKTLQFITLSLLILLTLLFISDSLSLLISRRLSVIHTSSLSSSNGQYPSRLAVTTSPAATLTPTSLKHIVFGIGSGADQWESRKPYVKFWWRPHQTRGFVWLDKEVINSDETGSPVLKVSEDTSGFEYTNRYGPRSGLRMTRIVSEMARMGIHDVRWFVMGDDDTVFFPDNLVRVLSKYDHTQMYYIGSNSETHAQNIKFSYGMAYGGGGFAISYPLAMELEKMQDGCIQKYGWLYGSDDRIHACLGELGVPLTREPGFHQFDVMGNVFGILTAHPVAPLVSLHHLDVVDPIFPSTTRQDSLQKLAKPAALDSASLMQQSICYDNSRNWTISVSWGYAVQIVRGRVLPTEMGKPARTFLDWYGKGGETAFSFNTRPYVRHPCQKPYVYYLLDAEVDGDGGGGTVSRYQLHNETRLWCWWQTPVPSAVVNVEVYKKPNPRMWDKAPRRNCCRVLPSSRDNTMEIEVGGCRKGEVIEAKWSNS
ncbi:hypothetical protein V2J09_013973 [Rumex salicifolius]